jgi:D-alanyl-lipoteichoic acid acyltransferase DltB (MBOAT superfamily)
MSTTKHILTGDNNSRNIYRAQQTFEAVVLIAALSYIYTDNNIKREGKNCNNAEQTKQIREYIIFNTIVFFGFCRITGP